MIYENSEREKEIPMKPYVRVIIRQYECCCSCGEILRPVISMQELPEYCPGCGQKIDGGNNRESSF